MSFRGFTGSSGRKDEPTTGVKPSTQTSSGVALVSTPAASATRSETYIGRGARLSGTFAFPGPVELDCQLEGEIEGQDRVVLGESAMVHARIRGVEVVVKGAVQGDIVATKRLVLKKPAKVAGNISAPSLVIEEGVLFEGKCTMIGQDNSAEKTPHSSKGVLPLKSAQDKVA